MIFILFSFHSHITASQAHWSWYFSFHCLACCRTCPDSGEMGVNLVCKHRRWRTSFTVNWMMEHIKNYCFIGTRLYYFSCKYIAILYNIAMNILWFIETRNMRFVSTQKDINQLKLFWKYLSMENGRQFYGMRKV